MLKYGTGTAQTLPGQAFVGEFYETDDILGPLSEAELKHAPSGLYLTGDESLLTEGQRVAIVGSRKASQEGMARAKSLTDTLVENDITIVSGLAEGIDTVAHETAIMMGGKTIAVLGTPLSQASPVKNQKLLEKIKSEHLAISQFPEELPVKPENFPKRNRTMALICDATIVVEAAEKSGTRHQGWESIRLGRPVFIMQNVARNPNLSWPKQMIEYGAQELCREDMPYIFNDLPRFATGGVFAF